MADGEKHVHPRGPVSDRVPGSDSLGPDSDHVPNPDRATGESKQLADEEVFVEVYSGHTYAERPRAFTCRGRRYTVEAVEETWRMPGGRGFLVRTETGERWELVYDEVQDRWLIQSVIEGDGR